MERDQVEGESLFFQDLFAAFNPSNYYPANDDPWVPEPIRVSPERHHDNQSFGAAGSSRPAGLSLPGWWSTGPSESGTLPQLAVPSDSGYETRENASILDGMDWSQDIQSIAGRMGDLNPFAGLSLDSCSLDSNAYGESGPGPTGPAILDSHNFAPPDELKCNMCEKPVRTKSELMKHYQRHIKPYKCDAPDCRRQEGFSTRNDLDRHKRSVHPDLATAGPRYRCHLGQCQKKVKLWPRADNFRSHLKRVHNLVLKPDEELTRFIVLSTSHTHSAGPLNQVHLEGVGSAMESSYPESASPLNPALSLDQGSRYLYMQHSWTGEPTSWSDLQRRQPAPAVSNTAQAVCGVPAKPPTATGTVPGVPDVALCTATFSPLPPSAFGIGPLLRAAGTVEPQSTLGTEMDNAPELRQGDIGNVTGDMEFGLQTSSQPPSENNEANSSATSPWEETAKEGEDVGQKASDDRSSGDDLQHRSSARSNRCNSANREDTFPRVPQSHATHLDRVSSVTTRTETGPSDEMDMDEEALWAFLHKVPERLLKKFVRESAVQPSRQSSTSAESATSLYKCPNCTKRFRRKCELRKHLKRHDRPYRCTFPWCGKEFGSKNDWKRHENSQHYQLEVWRCDEQPAELPGKECGQLFPRRALLRQHLQTVHGVEGGPRQEEQLNKCRVGRNLERRFWCGFCSRMVDASRDGPHVGAERFDHIDDHISGRNGSAKKTMAEWKSMESVTDILDVDFGPPPIRLADTSYNPAALAQLEDDTLSQSFLIKPGKRKLLDDQREEESQPKRMKEGNWMWTCCHCSMKDNAGFDSLCVSTDGCGHKWCQDCIVIEID